MAARFLSDYGMLVVLAALCAFLSLWTIGEQQPSGAVAAEQVAAQIVAATPAEAQIGIIARDGAEDLAFVATLQKRMDAAGRVVVAKVNGGPREGAQALRGVQIDAIAVTAETGAWSIFPEGVPRFGPTSFYGSTFLTVANLFNIADQIAVIAIMAIGMTLVIIAGGIDLSSGSLLALSAVLSTWLIQEAAGAVRATPMSMIVCCAAGIVVCALVGLGTGLLVTVFRMPAFIVTLGVMLIARGSAEKLTKGQSVSELPDGFTWLGRASTLGLPNAVFLMIVLYAAAHFLMSQTVLGRYLYAVGGNAEAARLSGVPVRSVIVFSYVLCGALAGVGGVITASQLRTGSPIYGDKYELFVIAAVVVGGTSLSGGEGKILGTLIGAFLIAVINNGMNLLGLQSWDQQIVLGAVIILAVLLDRFKQMSWRR